MGRDCRGWIEYRAPWSDGWYCLASVHFLRDYALFHPMGLSSEAPIQPRGLPDDRSITVWQETHVLVTDRLQGPDVLSIKEAARLTSRALGSFRDGENILDPSEFGHSWFTPEEFEDALRIADDKAPERNRVEAWAVLAAMQALPEARLVFCFDA